MARWFGYTLSEIDALLLTDVWMLDRFLARHPPVDMLVASYLGYKQPGEKGKLRKPNRHEAARANAEALAAMPPRRNVKTLAQMPEFLRTPEKMKMLEETRRQWQTTNSE